MIIIQMFLCFFYYLKYYFPQIKEDVNLPNEICKLCLEDLEVAFRFHKSCERSNAILASILKSDHSFGAESTNSHSIKIASSTATAATEAEANNFVKKEENYICSDADVNDDSFDCDIEVEMTHEDEELANIEYVAINQKTDDDDDIIVEDLSVEMFAVDSNVPTTNEPSSSTVCELALTDPTKDKPKPSECVAVTTEKKPKRQYRKKSKVEETNLNCVICGNVYKYPQDLERHIKRHTNDKQYMCS